MQKALIQRFKDTYTGPPAWAWQFNPPIPLIGKDYKPGEGLLIYASAENLAYLNKEGTPPRFGNEDAWNRYRVVYEQEGRDSKNFFPNIGIQPVTDGGLFAAGLFVAGQCGLPQHSEPRSFLETIAVTNWCKFIIKNKTNRDYVKNPKKLTESLPFVVGELALLQPAVILIPKAIWRHGIIRAAMREASPRSRFLPVYQFNATVVNTHLRKYEHEAAQLRKQLAGTPPANWMKRLKRLNKDNAWRYMAMLEKPCLS